MKEHRLYTFSFETPGRRTLLAFVCAVLIVACIELVCRAIFPSKDEIMLSVRRRVAEFPAPDVQVVGDSVARSGFLGSALGDTNVSVRNDAIAGGTPAFTYLLLEQEFSLGHVPKALVIYHSPHTFKESRYSVLVGSFATWPEVPELLVRAVDWTDVMYGSLAKLSYIIKYRDSFRLVLTRGDTEFFADDERYEELPMDSSRLDSFFNKWNRGDFAQTSLPTELSDRYVQPFSVSKDGDKQFSSIIELAKLHKVSVFWITMPVPERIKQERSKLHYEEEMLAYLGKFSMRGELHILQGKSAVYPDNYFRDLSHLNDEGAIKFGCDIGKFRGPILEAIGSSNVTRSPSPEWTKACELMDVQSPRLAVNGE